MNSPDPKEDLAPKPGAPNPYVEAFARLDRREEPAWLLPVRQAGLARFAAQGLPTLQNEDWRFTNVAPLAALPFKPAWQADGEQVQPADVERLAFADLSGERWVFIDGHFVPRLSRLGSAGTAVRVASLSQTLRERPDWIAPWLRRASEQANNPFAALNEAYFTDGLTLFIPKSTALEQPIHALFVSTGAEAGRAAHVRNVIVAEANAAATVIEHYVSLGSAATVTNAATTLIAGEGANVEHVRFQDEGSQTFHLGALEAVVDGHANVTAHSFALGARLSRQDIRAVLAGPGLEAVLNGLYLADGDRVADHYMVVDHAQPQCASHEYFNGILSDRSRGVFHGRILVRPGAQKTDAKQTNKNILLSDDATVNTKPQLEIYADDVKCTHGATIGQLHPESIFYLRSRGLPLETARRMLIHAFAGEIIERVRCSAVRAGLDRLVWERLERDQHVHLDL